MLGQVPVGAQRPDTQLSNFRSIERGMSGKREEDIGSGVARSLAIAPLLDSAPARQLFRVIRSTALLAMWEAPMLQPAAGRRRAR